MYKRILIKISGEALEDKDTHLPYNPQTIDNIYHMVDEVLKRDIEVMLVVGGGNIFRGRISSSIGVDPATGDYMGMLATIMNAMALQSYFEKKGIVTRVMSALPIDACCEPYLRRKAISHLERKRVVIFAAGIGSPFFTTDTSAALRAKEMSADCIFMGKNGVEGVYSADPKEDKNAILYKKITYEDIINKNLKVMDQTAISLLRESDIDVRVFNMNDTNNLVRILDNEDIGTLITKE